METKTFKQLFHSITTKNGFKKKFDAWYREEPQDAITTLYLQKSNFGSYYVLRVNIYFNGAFDRQYPISKELLTRSMGNLFLPIPEPYEDAFHYNSAIEDVTRYDLLADLFDNYLTPLLKKIFTKGGILEVSKSKEITVLPPVEEELRKLGII